MKKIFFRTAIVSALIVLGGCGSSAGTNSGGSNNGGSNSNSGYTSAIRDNFVNACSTEGDYNTCVCMFDYITNNLSYADFVTIENEINNGSSVSDYPVFMNAANSCT
jgi:hypothetical protein